MELKRFINEVISLGFPTKPILDFIRILYIVRELPYERVIKISQYLPHPTETLFRIEDWVVKLLRRYDLIPSGISETTSYGEVANVRYYKLTEKGLQLGSQIFQKYLQDVIDRLVDVLGRYPQELIRIIALSAISPRDGGATWLAIKVNGLDLDTVFSRISSEFEMLVMSPEELIKAYMDSKRAYGDLRLVFDRLRKARVRMYEPQVYDVFISKVLVEYNGKVHEKALNLMEELSILGLARKVQVYTSKGEYSGDEYRAPPEIVYILEEYSANADLNEIRKMFLAAELMMRALSEKVTKHELLTALSKLGISEEEVKIALEVMYQQGVTSRYNEAGGPESPAFIIIDKEKAEEEVKRVINLIESIVLH